MNFDELGKIDRSTFGRIETARNLALDSIEMPYELRGAYVDFSDGYRSESKFSELLNRSRDAFSVWDDTVDEITKRAFLYTDNADALEECEELMVKTSLIVHMFRIGSCETFATVLEVDRITEFIEMAESMRGFEYQIPEEQIQKIIGEQAQGIIEKLTSLCDRIEDNDVLGQIEQAFTAAGKWVLGNCNAEAKTESGGKAKERRKPCEDTIKAGKYVLQKRKRAYRNREKPEPRIEYVRQWCKKNTASVSSIDRKLQDNPHLWKDGSNNQRVSADKAENFPDGSDQPGTS